MVFYRVNMGSWPVFERKTYFYPRILAFNGHMLPHNLFKMLEKHSSRYILIIYKYYFHPWWYSITSIWDYSQFLKENRMFTPDFCLQWVGDPHILSKMLEKYRNIYIQIIFHHHFSSRVCIVLH